MKATRLTNWTKLSRTKPLPLTPQSPPATCPFRLPSPWSYKHGSAPLSSTPAREFNPTIITFNTNNFLKMAKNPPEEAMNIQLSESGGAALVSQSNILRKSDVMQAVIRLLCLLTSSAALTVMTTAKQSATITLYGFTLPLYSKWSFSDSFVWVLLFSLLFSFNTFIFSKLYCRINFTFIFWKL